MEQPRVERTFRLMRLMSGNAYLTVEHLAKRLDTSTRSIYRYIDTFKTCGFAVEKIDDFCKKYEISEKLLLREILFCV